MAAVLQPWQILVAALAGWISRIELATRRIEIAGVTPGPNEAWMIQIGRNLTDSVDGFLADKKLVILDRDSKYSAAFRDLLKGSSVEVVRLPPSSRNLNTVALLSPSSRVTPITGWSRRYLVVGRVFEHYGRGSNPDAGCRTGCAGRSADSRRSPHQILPIPSSFLFD